MCEHVLENQLNVQAWARRKHCKTDCTNPAFLPQSKKEFDEIGLLHLAVAKEYWEAKSQNIKNTWGKSYYCAYRIKKSLWWMWSHGETVFLGTQLLTGANSGVGPRDSLALQVLCFCRLWFVGMFV